MHIDWGSAPGYGALLISLGNAYYNFHQARREPIQERQRSLRDQLRVILREVQSEGNAALKLIETGESPPESIPPIFTNIRAQLNALTQEGLSSPGPRHLDALETLANVPESYWKSLYRAEKSILHDKELGRDPDDSIKQKFAALSQLQTRLTKAVSTANEYIEIIAKIDNGDRKTFATYER